MKRSTSKRHEVEIGKTNASSLAKSKLNITSTAMSIDN